MLGKITFSQKQFFIYLVFTFLVLPILFSPLPTSAADQLRVSFKMRPGVNSAEADRAIASVGGQKIKTIDAIGVHVIEVPSHSRAVDSLLNNPNIEWAEKEQLVPADEFIPNDTYYSLAWHLDAIGASNAWDVGSGLGIIATVCDSGVDGAHPDLVGQLLPGWNTVSQNDDWSPITSHGTSVAGVIAATTNNQMGVSSIAWSAKIFPVRVTNRSDGAAYPSDIAECVTWGADRGARIANASFANLYSYSVMKSAGAYAMNLGGLTFVSAGNYSTYREDTGADSLIVVSATTSTNQRASYSDYGPVIDLAAPGSEILTTTLKNGYTQVSGTSFSSPVAAAVAAVVMSANSSLSAEQVETILKNTAYNPDGVLKSDSYGYGIVQMDTAVAAAVSGDGTDPGVEPEPEPSPPVPEEDVTAPEITYFSLQDGDVLYKGRTLITATASDNNGVQLMQLFINGDLIASSSGQESISYSWNTRKASLGSYVIQLNVTDTSGNMSQTSVSIQLQDSSADSGDGGGGGKGKGKRP